MKWSPTKTKHCQFGGKKYGLVSGWKSNFNEWLTAIKTILMALINDKSLVNMFGLLLEMLVSKYIFYPNGLV
jgi:hypothetical protein